LIITCDAGFWKKKKDQGVHGGVLRWVTQFEE